MSNDKFIKEDLIVEDTQKKPENKKIDIQHIDFFG